MLYDKTPKVQSLKKECVNMKEGYKKIYKARAEHDYAVMKEHIGELVDVSYKLCGQNKNIRMPLLKVKPFVGISGVVDIPFIRRDDSVLYSVNLAKTKEVIYSRDEISPNADISRNFADFEIYAYGSNDPVGEAKKFAEQSLKR